MPRRAPHARDDRERAELRPEVMVAHHHVAQELREVRQRQHVAIARRNVGYAFGVKNVPEMSAIGR